MSDVEMSDTILRVAAAAGCELHHASEPGQVRRLWASAPLVLLDAAAVGRCAHAGLPRRADVVVVHTGEPPPAVTWQHALAVGAEGVFSLPSSESWLVTRFTEVAEGLHETGPVLAVIGGRGGAGASVLATAVAITAARDGERVLLVDCDPLGGGLDLVLGAEDLGGLRWPGIGVGGGRIPATALHAALPAPAVGRGSGKLALLSCDRSDSGPSPAGVTSVVEAGRRAGETVVCDLPRYPTDAAVAALTAADLTVLVVPADVRSCAAGARVAAVLAEHTAAVRLVVRGPAPGGVEAADVARALELPLLAAMPSEPGLPRAVERGAPPSRRRGPLAGAARTILAELRAVTSPAPAGPADGRTFRRRNTKP